MKYPEARKSALKDRLLPLLRHDAPSGCEEAVLAYLAEQAQPYCRHVSYDNFGNLICHVGGSGPRMMVCAHADQVGFIIKSISPEGFLFFHKVGGTPDKQLEARQVLVNGTVPGIIGCKPGHLMTAAEKNTVTPPSELFIDIGVSSRAEAEALGIEVGSYAVQRYNYMEMADPDLICSRGLDDRAGCAVVLELLAGIDPAALRQRYDFYHTRSNGALAAQPMPGAAQVLRKICALGGHNYIFTHRHVDEARKYLAKYGLSDYFREVVGPESPCFARKPAPDAILYLLRRYGIAPEAAVMIGDRDCDLGSARAAGIRTAHLLCPQVPQTLNADWHFADLGRLLCAL